MDKKVYPNEFAGDLHSEFELRIEEAKKNFFANPWAAAPFVSLPSLEVLSAICEECYHASFLREEGRPIRLRIGFIDWENLVSPNREWEGSGHFTLFHELMPLTAKEIGKLAAAVNISRAMLIATENVDGLMLAGVLSTNSMYRELLYVKQLFADSTANIVNIEADSPGKITARVGDAVFKELIHGRKVGINLALPKSLTSLLAAMDKKVSEPYDGDDRSTALSNCRMVLAQILDMIEKRGHGGTVILVPHGVEIPDDLVKLKYRTNSNEGRSIVEKWMKILHGPRGPEGFDFEEHYRVNREIESWVDTVAKFANVDGAMVITSELWVCGFGGEILGEKRELPLVWLNGEKEVSFEHHGTRHRSAVRFADQMPGAFIFIMSSDGGIKILTKDGVKIVYFSPSYIGSAFSKARELRAFP